MIRTLRSAPQWMAAVDTTSIGPRASQYVAEHGYEWCGSVLVADRYEMPRGVARTLTRTFGKPQPIEPRGEVAYWRIVP